MVVGTVAAVAASFGPLWLVRVGVGVALAMAFGSVAFAWHELDVVRRAHSVELHQVRAAMVAAATKHHADSIEMIERFNGRTNQLSSMIAKLRGELASAQAELSTMRGNSVWLRSEIADRQATIDALTTEMDALTSQVSTLEAALTAKHDGPSDDAVDESAEIFSMPRYGVSGRRTGVLPTAEELWEDGNFPTLVDLTAVAFPERHVEERRQA